jgi:nitrite reductase/ring-hydroxylating ferredoxin subunit
MPGLRGFPYTSHPTGWFIVALSSDVPKGTVKPLRYFSKDLVAYRGDDDKVVIMDALCGHNGAHLGYGGKVDGDCIVCPFHAWKWGPDGKNVDIPYSRILHNNARMGTHHVWEESGIIRMWHDAEGKEPYWKPMQLPEDTSGYYPLAKSTVVFRNKSMYGQWFIENAADPAHVKYVHLAQNIGYTEEYRWNGPFWGLESDQERPRLGWEGMSLTINQGHPTQPKLGDYDYSQQVNIAAVVEVEPCVTDVWLISYISKEQGFEGDEMGPRAERALQSRVKNVSLDFELFDHMVYRDGPVWPPEESRIWNDLRKWGRQFYPVDTGIRSYEAGWGVGANYVRQEDSVVGGQRGRGPAQAYQGYAKTKRVIGGSPEAAEREKIVQARWDAEHAAKQNTGTGGAS